MEGGPVFYRLLVTSLTLALLSLPACASVAERSAPRAGQVTFPSGRVFFVELAISSEEQARGYMGRREIGPEEGLLFHNQEPAIRRFWMKNCLVPIDMIWLDGEHKVLYIERSAPPCVADPCPSYGPFVPSLHVLEVAGGIAAEAGLAAGDHLEVVTDPTTPD